MSSSVQRDVRRLKQVIANVLNHGEQTAMAAIINRYYDTRDVTALCRALLDILDTPAKRHVIGRLRRVLPRSDRPLYDRLTLSGAGDSQGQQTERKSRGAWGNAGTRSAADGRPPRPVRPPAERQNITSAGLGVELGTGGGGENRAPRRAHAQGAEMTSQLSKTGISNGGLGFPRDSLPDSRGVKRVLIEQSMFETGRKLGLSIRGGVEHGLGIYVSSVDRDSVADLRGLVPGDLILSVNDISFSRITNQEAIKIIQSCRRLDMEVLHAGRVPGSYETNKRYMWVDEGGRTTSPPPPIIYEGRYDGRGGEGRRGGDRKSGLMLLKADDERRVHLKIGGRRSLGIMVRGGSEVGLGIYISGVDPGSAAHGAGLRVGDQILDVNGVNFLNISHAEALLTLKSSKSLIMTIKDVGKIPYAMTTYDKTEWIVGKKSQPMAEQAPSSTWSSRTSSSSRPHLLDNNDGQTTESVFMRGIGSQLMHSSHTSGQRVQFAVLAEQARRLLARQEQTTFTYYVTEYQQGRIAVESLVLALLQLLNTKSKMTLMTQLRTLISAKDLEKYDSMLLVKEIQSYDQFPEESSLQQQQDSSLYELHDTWAQHSLSSIGASSLNGYTTDSSTRSNTGGGGGRDAMDPLRQALEELLQEERKKTKKKKKENGGRASDSDLDIESNNPTPPILPPPPPPPPTTSWPPPSSNIALLPYHAEVRLRPITLTPTTTNMTSAQGADLSPNVSTQTDFTTSSKPPRNGITFDARGIHKNFPLSQLKERRGVYGSLETVYESHTRPGGDIRGDRRPGGDQGDKLESYDDNFLLQRRNSMRNNGERNRLKMAASAAAGDDKNDEDEEDDDDGEIQLNRIGNRNGNGNLNGNRNGNGRLTENNRAGFHFGRDWPNDGDPKRLDYGPASQNGDEFNRPGFNIENYSSNAHYSKRQRELDAELSNGDNGAPAKSASVERFSAAASRLPRGYVKVLPSTAAPHAVVQPDRIRTRLATDRVGPHRRSVTELWPRSDGKTDDNTAENYAGNAARTAGNTAGNTAGSAAEAWGRGLSVLGAARRDADASGGEEWGRDGVERDGMGVKSGGTRVNNAGGVGEWRGGVGMNVRPGGRGGEQGLGIRWDTGGRGGEDTEGRGKEEYEERTTTFLGIDGGGRRKWLTKSLEGLSAAEAVRENPLFEEVRQGEVRRREGEGWNGGEGKLFSLPLSSSYTTQNGGSLPDIAGYHVTEGQGGGVAGGRGSGEHGWGAQTDVEENTIELAPSILSSIPRGSGVGGQAGIGEKGLAERGGRLELVKVEKRRATLGIAIEGGANTRQTMPRVVKIQESGSAYESSLREGHVIVEVNGRSMFGLEHSECAKLIADCFRDQTGPNYLELLVLSPQ